MKQNQTFKRLNSYNPKLPKDQILFQRGEAMQSVHNSPISQGFSSIPQQGPSEHLIRAMDLMLNRFETIINNQNGKFIQFQTKVTEHIISKFDKIISYNKRICDGIERMIEVKTPTTGEDSSPVVSPRLKDFFKEKKEGSLKQSIISLNKSLQNDQIQKPLNILAPLPTLDQSVIIPTSKSFMHKKNPSTDHTSGSVIFQKAQSIKSSDPLEEVAVALISTSKDCEDHPQLNEWVGNFYNTTASFYFQQYSTGKINYEDMKIRFCSDILNHLLNFSFKWEELKGTVGKEKMKQKIIERRNKFYKVYNQVSKKTLQFLISKYPPSRRKKIDSELSQKIKQIKCVSVTKHDILKNAKMQIGLDQKQTDFTKQIKTFLNKLIMETNKQFPQFKKNMKQIFLAGDSDSRLEGGIQNEVQFLIGRKIPEGVALYTNQQLQSPGLEVKSPELLRILVKWCQELLSYFNNPEQKIFGNKFGFKNVKVGALPIKIPRSRLQELVDNLNKIFENQVKPIQDKQHKNIGSLIMDLMNLSIDGMNSHQFLNSRQITIAKLSQYLNDSLKSYVLVFLNLMLSKLIKIRSLYNDQKLEANIHLVTFGVMDLLRCKCIGSKSDINRIYQRIIERKDYFEVIRIKNKLNEATRDILINLKLKNSFLICEVQLSLGQIKEEINDHFCHYLYQLQRASFGVIFECASQISNLDPKMNYIKKQKSLMFRGSPKIKTAIIQGIKTVDDHACVCSIGHPETQMDIVSNQRPFCCSLCTKFMSAHTLCLNLFRCSLCSITLCPQCIIMMNRSNKNFIQQYTTVDEEHHYANHFFYEKHLYQGMCESEKVRGRLPTYLHQYPYVLHVVANNVGYKRTIYKRYKNSYTQAFSTLPQLNKSASSKLCWNYIQALKPFQRKYISQLKDYNKYHISLQWSELESILQQNQIKEIICVIDKQTKSALIVDIIETQQEIDSFKLSHDIEMTIQDTNFNHQQFLELTSKKLQSLASLEEVQDKQAITILNLWENRIKNIDILVKFKNVKELFLRQNIIQKLDPILEMKDLESAFVSDNKLKGPLPSMNFPLLNYLDISLNQIDNLQNIKTSCLNSLVFFRMVSTKITSIPLMDLPKLQVFWFDHNEIKDVSNLFNSKIPQLTKISGTHNLINGQLPQIWFQKLQNLVLNYNQITSIQSLCRSHCYNLKTISLHHNCIVGQIPQMMFPYLTKIDLSYNRISRIPQETFTSSNMRCLEVLDLKCNQISGKVPLFELPGVKKIDLSNNMISDIESFCQSKAPKLIYLDLSKNRISGCLPQLRFAKVCEINLSNNEIVSITNLSVSKLPRLVVLRCDYNRICTPIPRMYLQSLNILQLSNNSIPCQQFINYIHLLPSLKKVFLKDNPERLRQSIEQQYKQRKLMEIKQMLQFQDNYMK